MKIKISSPTLRGYIQAALYACGYREHQYTPTPDGLELQDTTPLKQNGDLIVKIAKTIEERGTKGDKPKAPIIPLTGDEKASYKKVAQTLGLQENATLSELLDRYFQQKTDNKFDQEYSAPTALIPEFYEYNRVLGYADTQRKKEPYRMLDLHTYLLGLAGYVTSYLDRVKTSGARRVEVHLLPTQGGAHRETVTNWIELYDKIRFSLKGIMPATSLLLWLSLKTHYEGTVEILALKPARGQNPTTIWATFNLDLTRSSKILGDVDQYADTLTELIEDSLNPSRSSITRSNIALRISQLIYEVINDVKPPEELMYIGAREGVLSAIKEVNGSKLGAEDKMYARYSKLVRHLYHKLTKLSDTVP